MKTCFEKSFERDIKKVDKILKTGIKKAVLSAKQAQTLREISNLRKVEGCKKGISYRIRIGKYRIGVEIVGDMVTFRRFGHRRYFYKIFP